jgi:hypothetical protein
MNRPNKTRHIYFELKKLLGKKFFVPQLLKSASLFVGIADVAEENNPITAEQMQDFFVPYTEKGVDELMIDGGWTILYQEQELWLQRMGEDEAPDLYKQNELKNYQGFEVAA